MLKEKPYIPVSQTTCNQCGKKVQQKDIYLYHGEHYCSLRCRTIAVNADR